MRETNLANVAVLFVERFSLDSGMIDFPNILCTINLAIVLYGLAHPHQIPSFICCHDDTSADHLTRFSI